MTVHVDLADATTTTAGTILRSTAGGRPGLLSARAVDVLACDADLTVQLTDGMSPLTRLKETRTLPEQVRAAVLDRDRGCRWPACTALVWHCDVHHLTPWAEGGSHHPDNLLSLCRRHHRRLHGPHWGARLDPRTGELALHHRGARRPTHTTLPHDRPHRQAAAAPVMAASSAPATASAEPTAAAGTTGPTGLGDDRPPEVGAPR